MAFTEHAKYFRATVQYLPFYGGARGQYLEIKKDDSGTITSEKIVAEENINSDNIIKNSDGNLLTKVMVANLQNLKTLSTNLLRLASRGTKAGSLQRKEKLRFKNQLGSLGEAASNIIKLIDEVNDIDALFKKNTTLRKIDDDDYDGDYIEQEEDDFQSPPSSDEGISITGHGLIAEAKPVGLAVVGENGLAASRPMATAIAHSGVAIAKPMATAIAGVDPAALGISLQINHEYSKH